MDKIASPAALTQKLREVLSYCGTTHPEREKIAQTLRELAAAVGIDDEAEWQHVLAKLTHSYHDLKEDLKWATGSTEVFNNEVELAADRVKHPQRDIGSEKFYAVRDLENQVTVIQKHLAAANQRVMEIQDTV
jgi:hypothetical protein